MWLQVRPSEPPLRKEISLSSSYINNKNKRPKIGACLNPKKIVFVAKGSDLKNDEWEFINADQEIKSQISCLSIMYDDTIAILK